MIIKSILSIIILIFILFFVPSIVLSMIMKKRRKSGIYGAAAIANIISKIGGKKGMFGGICKLMMYCIVIGILIPILLNNV